jgi:hypothetical protein
MEIVAPMSWRGYSSIRPLHALLVLSATLIAHGQGAQASASGLAIKAEVVLTPQFCATKSKKGSFISNTKETFAIGQAACPQIERALKNAFASVTRVEMEPPPGAASAQVILVPKFVDISATRTVNPLSDRVLVVLLEWTAKDPAGKPVWIETVQGSAKNMQSGGIGAGPLGTNTVGRIWESRNRKRIIVDAVRDLAEASARRMSEAPELRKLVQ